VRVGFPPADCVVCLYDCVRGELWRLRDAKGKAPGLIGWWPEQSITFVENHDTGSSQKLWPFPAERLAAGYVYILTHPGTPCVFSEHYFDQPGLQDTIEALLQVGEGAAASASPCRGAVSDDWQPTGVGCRACELLRLLTEHVHVMANADRDD
jgi:glycosidase